MFACIASHKSAEPDTLVVKMEIADRDALIADDPHTSYLKEHYVGYPCVLVRLSRVHRDALRDTDRGAPDQWAQYQENGGQTHHAREGRPTFMTHSAAKPIHESSPPRPRAPRPALRHYLHRPRLHLRRRSAHAGGSGHRPGRMGMGDGHVHAVVLPLRDSHRRAGRSHRPAARAHPDRAVVVGVHLADRRGLELRPAPRHAVLLRRRRGGRVPQRVDRRVALVSGEPASEHRRASC